MRRVEPDGGLNVINEVTDVNGSHPSTILTCPRHTVTRSCEEQHRSGPAPSWSRNLETPARVRRQHCHARGVRPPVLLRPRRTGRPAGTTDELLDLTKCHAELLRGPRSLLATAAHFVTYTMPR